MTEPRAHAGSRFGGNLEDYPKPWRLQYGEAWSEPRPVKIYSRVWETYGPSIGGNGHHHVDIREEDNSIWIEEDGGCWGRPWRWDEDNEMRSALKGRSESSIEFIRKRDVVKWAVAVLRNWGVLNNPNYKITWDLDDDDPYANEELAREMRKRAERAD